ncbi:MAG: Asp23/Gls24 family envelope stress response protein, partial [Clostridia bacterium]|nr:Asp23/Gls24 family envelope stress response protein [Clostridia bacterium]
KFNDNALYIDAFVKMKMGVDIVSVCEEAQRNIKESVQNMTGKAVSKISIHVVDIEINEKNTSK